MSMRLICTALLLTSGLSAQTVKHVEVTIQDFAALPKIVSSSLSTFGISLGMTREQAQLGSQAFRSKVHTAIDSNEATSLDLLDENNNILTIVDFTGEVVSRLSWQQALRPYLVGKSKDLLTPAVLEKDSPIRLQILGREDSFTSNVSGSILKIIFVTYVYDKEGLQVVGSTGDFTKIGLRLVSPARVR